MTIQEMLRNHRVESLITIREAAKMLGISCSEYCRLERTPEQLKAGDDFRRALKVVQAKIAATGETIGQVRCPVCGARLNYQRHSNGHIHGQCQTSKCLAWMM